MVGPGSIAGEHLSALKVLDRTRNCWVVGRSAESAAEFAGHWGFDHSTSSLGEALLDPGVDVVFICSPNALHAGQAEMALQAGKHVVVEIPLAMNVDQSRALVALSAQSRRSLQVCHTMRSFAAIRYVRSLHTSGRDRITQIVGFFGIPRRNNMGFSGLRSWADDLLWHHAGHLVDASLWTLGIEEICSPHLIRGPVNENLHMTMDLNLAFSSDEGCVIGHSLTYNTAELVWEMRFICESGNYLFRNGDLFNQNRERVVEGRSIRDLEPQNRQVLQHIMSGEPSDFEASGVVPSLNCLQRLQETAEVA